MDTIFLLIAALITLAALDFGGWRSRCAPGAWPSERRDLARSGERVRTGIAHWTAVTPVTRFRSRKWGRPESNAIHAPGDPW